MLNRNDPLTRANQINEVLTMSVEDKDPTADPTALPAALFSLVNDEQRHPRVRRAAFYRLMGYLPLPEKKAKREPVYVHNMNTKLYLIISKKDPEGKWVKQDEMMPLSFLATHRPVFKKD